MIDVSSEYASFVEEKIKREIFFESGNVMELNEPSSLDTNGDICLNCRCRFYDKTERVPLTLELGSVTLSDMCKDLMRQSDLLSPSLPATAYPSNMCRDCAEAVKSVYNFRFTFLTNYDQYTEEFLAANKRTDDDELVEKEIDVTSIETDVSLSPEPSSIEEVQPLPPPPKLNGGKKHKPRPLEIPRINVISPFESVSQTTSDIESSTCDVTAESTFIMNTYAGGNNLPSSLLPFTLNNGGSSTPSTPSKILLSSLDAPQPLDLSKESLLSVESPFKILFSPLLSSVGHFSFNFASPDHSGFAMDNNTTTPTGQESNGGMYSFGELVNDPGGGMIIGNEHDYNNNNNQYAEHNHAAQFIKTPTSEETPTLSQRYFRENVYTSPDVCYPSVVSRVPSPISPVLSHSDASITNTNTTTPTSYMLNPATGFYVPYSTASSKPVRESTTTHHHNAFIPPTTASTSNYYTTTSTTATSYYNNRLKSGVGVVVEEEKQQLTKCPKCDRYFESRSLYLDHKLAVHSLDQMSCFLCGTLVLGLTHLADHIRTMHLDEREVTSNLNQTRKTKFVGPKRKHTVHQGYSMTESEAKLQRLGQ